jgi:PAS domain S-box-containing protein
MHPAVTSSEEERLEALQSYEILDTDAEVAFDDLAALAARLCGSPVALLTLIDRDRQWIKAAVGIEERETPRSLSVCTHAIEGTTLMVVPDLTRDPRFSDNPLLRDVLGLRFYAGAPLITPEGHALGTICVMDYRPRELTPDQNDALTRLARQAIAQLELRRSLLELTRRTEEVEVARAHHARTGSILQAALESTADGLLVVDRAGGFVTFNRSFVELWRLPEAVLTDRDAALRHVLGEVRDPQGFEARTAQAYEEPERESYDVVEMLDGRVVERYSRPQRLDGEVVGRVWSFRDVTERVTYVERLRERERQLAQAQRLARLGYWDWDIATGVVHWSDEMCRIYGVEPTGAGIALEDFFALVHEADREKASASVQGALASGGTMGFEHRLVRPDGTVRTLHCEGEVVADADGKPVRMFGTGQDITARKEAEDELRAMRADAELMAARMRAVAGAAAGVIGADNPARLAAVLRDACRSALDIEHLALPLHDPENDAWLRVFPVGEGAAPAYPPDTEPGVSAPIRDEGEVVGALEIFRRGEEGYGPEDLEVLDAAVALAATALKNLRLIEQRRAGEEALRRAHAELEERVAARTAELAATNQALRAEIRERERAEAELQSREEHFRSLIENASDLITILAPDGTVRYESPALRAMLGYEPEELVGRNAFEFVHPDDVEPTLARLRAVLASPGSSTSAEFRFRNADGSWSVLEAVGTTLRPDTAAEGVVVNSRDVTARKQAEEALQFQTALLAAQNHTAIDGILVAHEGRVLSMNRRYAELFDIPEELRAPERCVEMFEFACRQVADPVAYEARIRELREQPEAVSRDEVRMADGRVLDRYTAPLKSADGRYYGRIWVLRDMTDRKRGEEELRLAKEEAERANYAKSEFLSRMSHELRTPMNSILGFGQILESKEIPPDQRKAVDHILKAGRHLLNLINEVLDLSRIEANRQELTLESVGVRAALHEATALIRPVAAQHGRELRSPEQVPDCWVWADPQRLTQVMLNLLSNAVKYNRPGGAVWLSCEADEERVRIGVHDSGPGIPTERLQELFVPFARLGAERSGVEGTGLGLALSRRLVEVMGGTLSVESTVGVGSTFRIELPATPGPLARLEESGSRGEQALSLSVGPTPRTILYIEDNLANWSLVEAIFADHPEIRLVPALQGRLGLELAREHLPDLILLDLHLPDVSGEAVLHELRADPRTRSIPVLMVSADATRHQIQRLREAGVQEYITKPFNLEQFLDTVETLLKAPPLGS